MNKIREPAMPSKFEALINAFRIQYNVNPLGSKEGQKKPDQLRVAAVLKKVLDSPDTKVSPEVKERARWWANQRANDPRVRIMFENSTDTAIEAFFLLPEQEQRNEVGQVQMPVPNVIYHMLKSLQPTLSQESQELIEARLTTKKLRPLAWGDVAWILLAILITAMVLKA
jgi:hypothetical protein